MIRTEDDLLDALRRRCDELRVSHRVLDNVAKFTDGYTGKLLCRPPIKRLNTGSLFWFLDAIGCSLQLVETQTAADLSSDSRATGKYDRSAIRRPTHGMSQFGVSSAATSSAKLGVWATLRMQRNVMRSASENGRSAG